MIEKLKEDKKYRAKIELIGYGIFILIAIMFAVSGNRNVPSNEIIDNSNNIVRDNKEIITLFDKYTYNIDVTINEDNYKFNGEYRNNVLTINKEDGSKYEYKDNNYYLIDTNEIVDDSIYSPVDKKYLNIDLVNQYLDKSIYEDGVYKVYLKDIILGDDSSDYITINYTVNLNQINIDIDYTSLLKRFNSDIDKYLMVMKYNKIID